MEYGLLSVLTAEQEAITTGFDNCCCDCPSESETVQIWNVPKICKTFIYEAGLEVIYTADGDELLSAQGEIVYAGIGCKTIQDDEICDPALRL